MLVTAHAGRKCTVKFLRNSNVGRLHGVLVTVDASRTTIRKPLRKLTVDTVSKLEAVQIGHNAIIKLLRKLNVGNTLSRLGTVQVNRKWSARIMGILHIRDILSKLRIEGRQVNIFILVDLSEVVVAPILSRERFGVTEVEDMTVTSWDRAPEPVLRIMDGVQMPFEVRTTLESLVAARNATNMVDWLVSAWKANQRMMPLRELRAFIKVSMLKKKKLTRRPKRLYCLMCWQKALWAQVIGSP